MSEFAQSDHSTTGLESSMMLALRLLVPGPALARRRIRRRHRIDEFAKLGRRLVHAPQTHAQAFDLIQQISHQPGEFRVRLEIAL